MRAMKAVALQAQGTSYKDALAETGIPTSARYSQKWTILFSKAATLVHRSLTVSLRQVIGSIVQESWPEVIQRMVNIALRGGDREAIEAAKFLNDRVVQPALDAPATVEDRQKEYLEKRGSFNPMAVLHADIVLHTPRKEETFADPLPSDDSTVES